MSKRKGDVDVMEFMVSSIHSLEVFYGNADYVVDTRMGTWSNSELARARGVGRETRPFRRLTFVSQDCAKQYDGHDFTRDDPRGKVPCPSSTNTYLTISDSLICLR
jgi:hypothetical protein